MGPSVSNSTDGSSRRHAHPPTHPHAHTLSKGHEHGWLGAFLKYRRHTVLTVTVVGAVHCARPARVHPCRQKKKRVQSRSIINRRAEPSPRPCSLQPLRRACCTTKMSPRIGNTVLQTTRYRGDTHTQSAPWPLDTHTHTRLQDKRAQLRFQVPKSSSVGYAHTHTHTHTTHTFLHHRHISAPLCTSPIRLQIPLRPAASFVSRLFMGGSPRGCSWTMAPHVSACRSLRQRLAACVCACVRVFVCARACVCACVCVCSGVVPPFSPFFPGLPG